MALSKRELDAVLQVQHRITNSHSVQELQTTTVAEIRDLIGANVCLFMRDPEQRFCTDRHMVALGFDDARASLYHNSFRDNPYSSWARRMRLRWKRPVALCSRVSVQARNTRFTADFLDPLGMHHSMAIGLVKDDHYLGLVGLFRPRCARDFGEPELAKAALLASSIRCALERSLAEEEVVLRESVIEIFNQSGSKDGIAVADSNLNVRYQNLAAAEILDKLRSPEERRSVPPGPYLPQAIRNRCQSLAGSEGADAASAFGLDTAHAGYAVNVRIVRTESPANARGFVVFLATDSATLPHMARMRKMGLSNREIDVLNAIASGLTIAEAASRLFISFYTAQSHMKSIYGKLNVHNRVRLLKKIVS